MQKQKTKAKGGKAAERGPRSPVEIPERIFYLLSSLLLVFLIWMIYAPTASFSIINWDDKRYLLETPMIQNLNWENVQNIFRYKILGSYNPLVFLSFAIDYHFVKTSPSLYHIENIIFHMMNAVLLLYCIRSLTASRTIAFFTAFMFAVHPMHVESIAWIASRKDVLFLFFYLLSWLAYMRFARKRSILFYVLAFFAFLLSLLSKPQAVTLPLLFIMTDYLLDQSWSWKKILDKIPFLLLSAVFGWVAVKGGGSVANTYAEAPDFFQRIIDSILACGIYIGKYFLPINQSAMYAFPGKELGPVIPELIMSVILIGLCIYLFIRFWKTKPLIAFGILFFFLHIFLLLHVIAVNSSLVYERFSYVSYIGLSIAVAAIPAALLPSEQLKKTGGGFYIFIPVILLFGFIARERTMVWKNGLSLWTDVIEKNPQSPEALINRGQLYFDAGEDQKAMDDYNAAIEVNPKHPTSFSNRSILYYRKGDNERALADADKALQLDSSYSDALTNRGLYLYMLGRNEEGLKAITRGLELKPNYPSALVNRAAIYLKLGRIDDAIADYHAAINFFPAYADAYKFLSLAYYRKHEYQHAMEAADSAESISSNVGARRLLSDAFNDKGNEEFQNGKSTEAWNDYNQAAAIDSTNPNAWYNIGGMYIGRNDLAKARELWKRTLRLDPNHKLAKEWLVKTGGL